MNSEQIKQGLRRFKPLFPMGVQLFAAQVWHSVEIPLGAVLERRAMLDVYRVAWPDAEVADFEHAAMLGHTADTVLVSTQYTVISPGTERAQLLGLPGVVNHNEILCYYPGYAGSGIVTAVGKHAPNFRVGDRVAGRIGHGTPAVIAPDFLFKVPEDVPLQDAAFVELGIIVLQGIRKAQIQPGESVVVIGQGLVGQLANRLARIAGGAPIIATARSSAKARQSVGPGGADHFFTGDQLADELDTITHGNSFDVVIEASGNQHILPYAVSLARNGGRVIGLGTPTGAGEIPLGSGTGPPGVTISGAHISGIPRQDESSGLWTYRSEGQYFLNLLADGKLTVTDLVTQRADPANAAEVYETLRHRDPALLGVLFDWQQYPLVTPLKKVRS
jgi:L-iditol 2-dehydrogenase